MQGQAAGLNSLVALALMGSTVSVATRWLNWASLLGIRREGLELLAGMRGPQLQRFRGRFHAEQGVRDFAAIQRRGNRIFG
jgi:hypothetical protein